MCVNMHEDTPPVIAVAITEPLVEVGDWLGQIKTEGQP